MAKWRDDTCALCEFVMSEAFGALNDTSDRRMVKNLLESACYRWEGNLLILLNLNVNVTLQFVRCFSFFSLPSSVENACVKLVNEFAEPIIDAIVHSVDPDKVCTKLQMCASSSGLPPPPPPRDSEAECKMCELIMTKLDIMILDKQNQEEVCPINSNPLNLQSPLRALFSLFLTHLDHHLICPL